MRVRNRGWAPDIRQVIPRIGITDAARNPENSCVQPTIQSSGGGDGPEEPPGSDGLAAIERIFRERHDVLIRLARHLFKRFKFHSRTRELEDAVQDTMVAIYRFASEGKFPDLATDDDRMRYIHKTMKNQVLLAQERLQAERRGGHYQRVEVDLDLRPAPQSPCGLMAERSDELDHFIDSIQDPSLCEIARGLREGRTCQEIAERLGISERTVRRKRQDLAKMFARRSRDV